MLFELGMDFAELHDYIVVWRESMPAGTTTTALRF